MQSDFVTLMTFMNIAEAEVKRLPLEEAGIKTYLTDAEIVSMDWLLGNAVGEIKLQVARDDAAKAIEILKNAPPFKKTHVPENVCLSCNAPMPENADTCPKCGWSYKK